MGKILVMTDSTCDLPQEWIARYDIRVVPTYVQFGQDSLADDGVQLSRAEFYRRLASAATLPTTAAPPLGQIVETMTHALDEADHVIGITAPGALSGIYNGFRIAAVQTDPKRVSVVDSQMTTMGLGWQVFEAAEMAEAGVAPDAICAALLAMQPRVDVFAAMDSLDYLRRSGRVGWAAAMLGSFLQIKPVVRLHQSVVDSMARVRTSQRAFDTLVELAHKAAPLRRLAVMHTTNLAGAERLKDALTDLYPPGSPVPIVEATPVLGVHVGPNALGLGIVRAD